MAEASAEIAGRQALESVQRRTEARRPDQVPVSRVRAAASAMLSDVLADKKGRVVSLIRQSGEFFGLELGAKQAESALGAEGAEGAADDIATGEVSDRVSSEIHELMNPLAEKLRRLQTLYAEILKSSHEGEGMDETHALFVDSLFSRRYLPLMKGLMGTVADQKDETTTAILTADEAMAMVDQYAGMNFVTPYEAFLALYDQAVAGENDFLIRLKRARDRAVKSFEVAEDCITDPVLSAEIEKALQEYMEAELGLQFPAHFAETLADDTTRALVVSLDFNSTYNAKESFPHPDLVARAQRALHKFVQAFRSKLEGKELYVTVNTGRPGMYAWGAVEAAFPPIPELRKVAVAEAGGVLLDEGLHSGVMQVAVENPQEWQSELGNIRAYLLDKIADPGKVVIEPKLSMLSIRLAENEDFILKSKDGEVVTPEWIQAQLQQYFEGAEEELDTEFNDLVAEMTDGMPNVEAFVSSLRNGQGKIVNGNKRKAMAELKSIIAEVKQDHQKRMDEIKARLATIEMMYEQALLQPKYNPTAGYVDIGHARLNKYSTLVKHVCESQQLTPDEVMFVQIGDSTTDILPEDLIGKGEPNEGADKAYLVAVRNSNEKMMRAVERRGEHGLTTQRSSILAVESLFKGLHRVVSRSV
ncbi:MAG TPA: hypothetical protein VI588_01615 [Candidatus Gracilibacteria bacterium]|nr:hypothetical protein [Candidatus Gracilibacteria bacterium]